MASTDESRKEDAKAKATVGEGSSSERSQSMPAVLESLLGQFENIIEPLNIEGAVFRATVSVKGL